MTLNFIHFQGVQQRYSISFSDNPDMMTISQQDPLTTSFTLQRPQKMQSVDIKITFRSIDENVGITPTVNTEQFETTDGHVPGGSRVIAMDKEDLRRVNHVQIEGEFGFVTTAEIASITVTGVTGTQNLLFLVLNILGIIILIGPILVVKYLQYARLGELEEQFPNFLRDVVEGTRAGMSLPQAIQNAQNNNYGRLTPFIEEMAAKLEWGVPFDKVMQSFARKTKSRIIRRSVNTIIQTYESGGNVSEVLQSVGKNLKEIRQLRKERESQIYGEMITGYIIYFVFLFVLIVLIRYFLPSLTFSQSIGPLGGSGLSGDQVIATYRSVFRWLIIVQSIFSGMVIGRLAEGNLKAGGKHVAILLGVGYTAALVFM